MMGKEKEVSEASEEVTIFMCRVQGDMNCAGDDFLREDDSFNFSPRALPDFCATPLVQQENFNFDFSSSPQLVPPEGDECVLDVSESVHGPHSSFPPLSTFVPHVNISTDMSEYFKFQGLLCAEVGVLSERSLYFLHQMGRVYTQTEHMRVLLLTQPRHTHARRV